MHHYGSSIRWIQELDLPDEAQQSRGVAGDAVVGPAGEVELTEFSDLMMALLEIKKKVL